MEKNLFLALLKYSDKSPVFFMFVGGGCNFRCVYIGLNPCVRSETTFLRHIGMFHFDCQGVDNDIVACADCHPKKVLHVFTMM